MPGSITIATNAAGRGTDIILSPLSLQNGGLHVLFTFYPESKRVADQGIGRAGRQGQLGSSQIIIHRNQPQIQKLIKNKSNFVSDEELITLLDQWRKAHEEDLAKLYMKKAELERYSAGVTETFYSKFRDWSLLVSKEEFIDLHSKRLCSLKMRSPQEYDLSHLSKKEVALATECLRLLTDSAKPLEWKIFLSAVIQHMKDKVIREWSLLFYHRMQKRLEEYQHINEEIRQVITADFNVHKERWERYLLSKGLGVFAYLEDITTIRLPTGEKEI